MDKKLIAFELIKIAKSIKSNDELRQAIDQLHSATIEVKSDVEYIDKMATQTENETDEEIVLSDAIKLSSSIGELETAHIPALITAITVFNETVQRLNKV